MYIYLSRVLKIFLPIFLLVYYIRTLIIKSRNCLKYLSKALRILCEDALIIIKETSSIKNLLFKAIEKQKASFPFSKELQTIFLIITSGQAVRTFLISDVLPLLTRQYNIVIISPYSLNEEFVKKYLGEKVHVLPWIKNTDSLVEKIATYYHMVNSPSDTHKSILENIRQNGGKYFYLYNFAKFLTRFTNMESLDIAYKLFIWTFLPQGIFRRLFKEYNPALVISTVAHHSSSWPLTYYACHHGCKVLANIISWDNISTKGLLDTSAHHYTLWSEEMSEELKMYFPYIRSKNHIVGSPQFDIYYKDELLLKREDFLSSLGLNPYLPYILYTTNTPVAMPDEHLIVRNYWKELNKAGLSNKVSLIIRLHPKDKIERYHEMYGMKNFALTLAGAPKWDGVDCWIPDREDMIRLANSMRYAAVIINVASTMSLESFCVKSPTINVAFQLEEKRRKKTLWSFNMYHSSVHYRALVENDAVAIARSMGELINHTLEALDKRILRQAKMKRVLRLKVAYNEGNSSERFSEVVSDILNGKAH
jgi:hypothetical protein